MCDARVESVHFYYISPICLCNIQRAIHTVCPVSDETDSSLGANINFCLILANTSHETLPSFPSSQSFAR